VFTKNELSTFVVTDVCGGEDFFGKKRASPSGNKSEKEKNKPFLRGTSSSSSRTDGRAGGGNETKRNEKNAEKAPTHRPTRDSMTDKRAAGGRRRRPRTPDAGRTDAGAANMGRARKNGTRTGRAGRVTGEKPSQVCGQDGPPPQPPRPVKDGRAVDRLARARRDGGTGREE